MVRLIANVTATLEKVIKPFIQDNFNKQKILTDQIKRNTRTMFMNDNFYAPVRSSRHGGVVNLANDGNSLVSSSAQTAQASVAVKIITGTFDISKLTIDATKTRQGAVEPELAFQARSLSSDFAKDVNRQLFNDGIGVIAEASGSVGAGTMSVVYPTASIDDGRVQDPFGTVNNDIPATEYIHDDMVVGIGTAAADLGTVTAVTTASDGSSGTVVMTGAPAIAANDSIYKVDGDGEGAGTSEITGLKAALGTATTYAGLTRSALSDWSAQRDATSEALTLSAMEDVYLAARKFSQTGDRYAILCNKTLYKKYGDILTSLRRTVNETDLLGGWSGLEFQVGGGRIGVFLDYDTPDGEVYILNLDTFTIAQVSDMDWMEDPSSGSLVRRRDKITFQATMVWFMNLICMGPAGNGKLLRKTA